MITLINFCLVARAGEGSGRVPLCPKLTPLSLPPHSRGGTDTLSYRQCTVFLLHFWGSQVNFPFPPPQNPKIHGTSFTRVPPTIPPPTNHASSHYQIVGSSGQLGHVLPPSPPAHLEGDRRLYQGSYTILQNRLDLDSHPSNTRFIAVISIDMAEFIPRRLEALLHRMFGPMN